MMMVMIMIIMRIMNNVIEYYEYSLQFKFGIEPRTYKPCLKSSPDSQVFLWFNTCDSETKQCKNPFRQTISG